MSTIKTEHVFPSIPDRSHDWHAYIDGHEEYGPRGWGATESAAIADLKDQLDSAPIHNYHSGPLSECCGAPALDEIIDNWGMCSDCKEHAEFKGEGIVTASNTTQATSPEAQVHPWPPC